MKQESRMAYVARIATEISDILTGNNFEQFGYIISDHYFNEHELIHRGTNLAGAPVGHIVDSVSTDATIVVEYSTESNYFNSIKKIQKDTKHSHSHYKTTLKTLLLFSNRFCPPKMQTKLIRRSGRILNFTGIKVVTWDARKIAEYIVDEVLFDDNVTERLSHYLPSITKIRNEEALNLSLPKPDEKYKSRPDIEKHLIGLILRGQSVILAGLSGIGKSSIANSVAHSTLEHFEISIWLDATDLTQLEQLSSWDVQRNGHTMNLSGLLRSRKCLLILDNISSICSADELRQICECGSAIIATRIPVHQDTDIEIQPIDMETSKKILEDDLSSLCPEDLLKKLYSFIGGYPLIYGLMNANLRVSGYDWNDIESDFEVIHEYTDDRNKKIAERLLGHHGGAINSELAFLRACENNQIDISFAKKVIKPIGVTKLKRSAILSQSSQDILKIHDIVYEILNNLELPPIDINTPLANYLNTYRASNWSNFLKASYRHSSLIKKLLKTHDQSIFLYSYLISGDFFNIDTSLIPSPEDQLSSLTSQNHGSETELLIALLLESIEVLNRVPTENNESEKDSHNTLESRLYIYDELEALSDISAKTLNMIRHHHGKSLLWVNKEETIAAAKKIFEELSSNTPPLREAQLQLARILIKEDCGEQAKDLIESILESLTDEENQASLSVALATFELITRKPISPYKDSLNERFTDVIADILKDTMAYGYDQGYRAFAVIAQNWSYHQPEKFLDVYECLPLPAINDLSDDYSKNAVADLIREAGKIYERRSDSKAISLFKLSLDFYGSMNEQKIFTKRRVAETLYRAEKYPEAEKCCMEIIDSGNDDPFTYFWISKSQLAQNKLKESIANIERAIDLLDSRSQQFKSTFLEVKSGILKTMNNPDYLEALQAAHDCCEDDKFKAVLYDKLLAESN